MSGLDLAVVAVYLVGVVAIGGYVTRRVGSEDDLFLAGRSLGFGAIGLLAAATALTMSAATLIWPAAPPPADTVFTLGDARPGPDRPRWQDYRLYALAILAVIAAIVIVFA